MFSLEAREGKVALSEAGARGLKNLELKAELWFLKKRISQEVNKSIDSFRAQPQGKMVEYFSQYDKPLFDTKINSIKGRYTAVELDAPLPETTEVFDLEVGFADKDLGTNLISFSGTSDAVWSSPGVYFDSLTDATHEEIPLADQVKALKQTLTVLKQLTPPPTNASGIIKP